MLFSSIPFLYYFLPAVLICYFLSPKRWRNGVLLLFCLIFYAWGEPKYIVLLGISILLGYAFGLAIEKSRGTGREKRWMVLSVATALGLLVFFKYTDFFLENLNAVTGLGLPLLRIALPIGISFYTFQILSYTIDVYRGRVSAQRNLLNFAVYVALFPQLIAGPIVRYADVERELGNRKTTPQLFYLGLRRFLFGLSKKVLLANTLGELCEIFRASGEKSLLFYWLYAIAFTLHIYFDFSGYSDMAIGLGSVFGFHFPENFDYPYISKSITEFWRRWHMTLGGWFRDYVYIPLGGNRVGKLQWVRNILVVWLCTGLWHGASWNFVLWGLLFAVLLIGEKLFLLNGLRKLPAVFSHIYTLFFILCGFVLFNADSLSQAAMDLGGLFGLGGAPLVTEEAVYYLRSYAVLLVVGIIGATPLCRQLAARAGETPWGKKLLPFAEPAVLAVLLLVVTAYLVDGSFNPFLYFRF